MSENPDLIDSASLERLVKRCVRMKAVNDPPPKSQDRSHRQNHEQLSPAPRQPLTDTAISDHSDSPCQWNGMRRIGGYEQPGARKKRGSASSHTDHYCPN